MLYTVWLTLMWYIPLIFLIIIPVARRWSVLWNGSIKLCAFLQNYHTPLFQEDFVLLLRITALLWQSAWVKATLYGKCGKKIVLINKTYCGSLHFNHFELTWFFFISHICLWRKTNGFLPFLPFCILFLLLVFHFFFHFFLHIIVYVFNGYFSKIYLY